MKRTKLAASFLLAGTLLLTGCVSKKELVNLQTDYNKLKDEKTALDKSYQDAQIQLAEYRTQSKSLEDRLNEARKIYKSGSYEINERAGETLSKIAKIITDYKDYEVLVEGNTDNVPISRPNIRNNWDLSALRASSVVQALQNQYGVDPKRLSAAGRGEYNPLTDNDTELGKQRNRRTQIIITPKLDQFLELIDKAPEAEGEEKAE